MFRSDRRASVLRTLGVRNGDQPAGGVGLGAAVVNRGPHGQVTATFAPLWMVHALRATRNSLLATPLDLLPEVRDRLLQAFLQGHLRLEAEQRSRA